MQIWNRPPSERASSGFTLIEVTLALAITSVALVSLMAMIPQGINTLTDATNRSIEARIHQQVISEVSLADWDERFNYDRAVYMYDNQGVRLDENEYTNSEIEDLRSYIARVIVPQPSRQLPPRIGGNTYTPIDFSADGVTENEVQLILVEVCSSPLVETYDDFDDDDNWRHINAYRSTITRLQDISSL